MSKPAQETETSHVQSRVVIVEDDHETRRMLARGIDASRHFRLLAEAATFDDAHRLLQTIDFDLLILDIDLDGMSALPLITESDQAAKVMVMTVFEDQATVLKAIALGADGYVVKSSLGDRLEEALLSVVRGFAPISPSVAHYLLREVRKQVPTINVNSELTRRETDVLERLARGHTYQQIADECDIAFSTVAFHVRQIYQKLRVNSKTAAVYEAMQRGIVKF